MIESPRPAPRIRSLPVRLGLSILAWLLVTSLASATILSFIYVSLNWPGPDPEALRNLPQPGPEDLEALLANPMAQMAVLFAGAMGGLFVVLVLTLVVDRRRPWDLEESRAGRFSWLGWGLVLGGILAAASMLAITALGGRHLRPEGLDGVAAFWAPAMVLTVFLLASAEELFVRGYLFVNIREGSSPVRAIVFTALLFTAVHSQGPGAGALGWFNVFLFGLILGSLRQLTGGLWLPVGVHAGWNLVMGMILGGQVMGGAALPSVFRVSLEDLPPILGGGEHGPESSVIVTILFLVAAGLLLKRFVPVGED